MQWSERFRFDSSKAVHRHVPCQLPAFTRQTAGFHAGRLGSVELFDDVREEQDFICFNTHRLLNVAVGLRLTLRP